MTIGLVGCKCVASSGLQNISPDKKKPLCPDDVVYTPRISGICHEYFLIITVHSIYLWNSDSDSDKQKRIAPVINGGLKVQGRIKVADGMQLWWCDCVRQSRSQIHSYIFALDEICYVNISTQSNKAVCKVRITKISKQITTCNRPIKTIPIIIKPRV